MLAKYYLARSSHQLRQIFAWYVIFSVFSKKTRDLSLSHTLGGRGAVVAVVPVTHTHMRKTVQHTHQQLVAYKIDNDGGENQRFQSVGLLHHIQIERCTVFGYPGTASLFTSIPGL